MKQIQYKSLGQKVNLSVPDSIEEFDQNAKKVGACLTEAINNVVYRGSLADFRAEFCSAVEDATGVERKTEDTEKTRTVTTKGEDGKEVETKEPIIVFAETEGKYIDRVIAEKGITLESLQPIADKIAAAIVFDASATEPKEKGPKKLAAKYIEDAKKALASGKVEQINNRLHKAIGKTFIHAEPTNPDADVLVMAQLIKEFSDWNEAQSRNKLLS